MTLPTDSRTSPTAHRFLNILSRKITPSIGWRVGIGCIVFALPFVLYLKTLCPTIYPGDGPELTAAAWCLGVPHPTGYPLFMVMGWIFTHVYPGTPAFSMNMLNAILGALAAVGAYRLARELWRNVAGVGEAGSLQFRIASAAFALTMAASATWWDLSTSTDVFTLFFIFLTFGWTTALKLIRKPTRGSLMALALISGFAFLNHQLYIITFPLAMVGVIRFLFFQPAKNIPDSKSQISDTKSQISDLKSQISSIENQGTKSGIRNSKPETRNPKQETRNPQPDALSRRFLAVFASILIFIIPLLGYAYLPIRAATHPPINWGNPRGVEGILWHLTGKAFRGTRMLSHPSGQPLEMAEIPGHLSARAASLARWVGEQYMPEDPERPWRGPIFTLLSVLIGGMGLYCLWRKARWAALGIALATLMNLVLVVIYTIADIEPYQMPLWIVLWLLVMVGVVEIGDLFPERYADSPKKHLRLRALAISAVSLALAAWGVVGWYPKQGMVNKSDYWDAYKYAQALLETVPPQSVIFTGGDYDLFPLWYAQVCEKKRPDVAVIGGNFVLNGWYRAALESTLPPGVRAFVGDEPPGDKGRWMVAFLGGMVAPQLEAGRHVYLTIPYDPDIAKYYRLVPVFQLPSPNPPMDKLLSGRDEAQKVVQEEQKEKATAPSAAPSIQPSAEASSHASSESGMDSIYIFEVKDPDNFSNRAMEQLQRDFPGNETDWAVGKK